MFNLFKSKKQVFCEKLGNYLNHLIKIAEHKNAQTVFSERLKSLIGENIYRPNIEKYYDETKEKDVNLHLSIFKHECIVSVVIQEVVQDKLSTNLNVLSRKRNMLVYKDDYGDYHFDRWFAELQKYCEQKFTYGINNWLYNPKNTNQFLDKVPYDFTSLEDGFLTTQILYDAQDWIEEKIDEYDASNSASSEYSEDMSGHEYEYFVADCFDQLGFTTQVTKGSGDHGVDVLVEYDDTKIAVQCKHYNSPVGNKAVQEVYSAKDIFDCALAVVVTNNTFTPAAREAAEKLGVYLLHHDDIPDFYSLLVGQ